MADARRDPSITTQSIEALSAIPEGLEAQVEYWRNLAEQRGTLLEQATAERDSANRQLEESRELNRNLGGLVVGQTQERWKLQRANRQLQAEKEKVEAESGLNDLTGLPGKKAFKLEAIARTAPTHRLSDRGIFTFVFLDFDNFKNVNSAVGEDGGDEVIAEAAKALNETLRDEDLIGHWGGDEFALLLAASPTSTRDEIIDKLRERLSRIIVPGHGPLSLSAGFAEYNRGADYDVVQSRAVVAKRLAKEAGKDTSVLWTPGMPERVKDMADSE